MKKAASQPKRLGELLRFVPTPDDWAPTIVTDQGERVARGKVFWDDDPRVSPRYFVRVCFWGDDDLGRDKDFKTDDFYAARAEYEKWAGWLLGLENVTFMGLASLGFVNG